MFAMTHSFALALILTGSVLAAPTPTHTLVVVDSLGQPADEMAIEAWRQTQHRNSKVVFRWIRIGSPEGARKDSNSKNSTASDAPPPEGFEPPPGPPPPPVEPDWDPEGITSRPWDLAGMPRVLLIDAQGQVRHREAFMSTPQLRDLVRHPDGFPETGNIARIKGVDDSADD